jgi:hypothetical protein
MIEFTVASDDLKKALSIVSMATGESAENIHGHTLFNVCSGAPAATLYATDNDKMAASYLLKTDLINDEDTQFTADPKRLQALLGSSDSKTIKLAYDKETQTLSIYASEDSKSYVSFASFDPSSFLTFDQDIAEAILIKTVNATIFQSGIKFIQGFLPGDDANKKYSNLFIVGGAMYGSNGSNKIGAYASDELADVDVTIRRAMIPSIGALVEKTDSSEISILETDKLLMFSTVDRLHSFSFRKSTIPVPKLPLSTDVPKALGFNVDRAMLLKKFNRLALTSRDEIGVLMKLSGPDIKMETVADRKSYETTVCKRVSEDSDFEFLLECNKFKSILALFQASNIDVYVEKTKCIIHSKADLLIEDKKPTQGAEPVKKSFTAVGLVTLAKPLS